MDPNILSTLDTVTDAKIPILYKIFPGLRAMTLNVIFRLESCPFAKQICNLETRIGGRALAYARKTRDPPEKTMTDSQIPSMPIALYRCRASICQPRIFNFFSSLRSSTSLPIGAAGFCWGGRYVALLCQDAEKAPSSPSGKALLDCGFTAHPSGLVLPTDIEAVKVPFCISNGSMDFQLKAEGNEMIRKIFARKEGELNGDAKGGKMTRRGVGRWPRIRLLISLGGGWCRIKSNSLSGLRHCGVEVCCTQVNWSLAYSVEHEIPCSFCD